MVNFAQRLDLALAPDESTYQVSRDECFPPVITSPGRPLPRHQSWSNEQFLATATGQCIEIMHLDAALFKTTKSQLKQTSLESITIAPITECPVYLNRRFDQMLKRHVLYAIAHHQKQNERRLDSWTHEIFHSKLWLHLQTSNASRLEVTLSTKTAETARSINNGAYQSLLDSGHLAAKVEFYPNTVKQAVPIGASILSVLTQDYRLYLYRYRRAHPNYWCELVDISVFYRNHVLSNFIQMVEKKGLDTESVSDELGGLVFQAAKSLAIVDYLFFYCSVDYVEVLLLTLNGSLVLIQCSLDQQQHDIIAEYKLDSDNHITRIYRLDETRTVLLIDGNKGTIGTVHVANDAIKPGPPLTTERDESISDIHSIVNGDHVFLFVARQCSLEKWRLKIDPESGLALIDESITSQYRRFDADCLPFIRIKSFLSHEATSVQATAVTSCGRVYLMETNSLGNFYQRYGDGETARIDFGIGSSIASAAIAPLGCTLSIAFEEEKIFLKSQDEPITRIHFYPAMRETDYETVLGGFLLSHSVDYLPVVFDLIMHLKRVQSDLIPIQKLLANPDIPPQVKYVLTRAIFPTMEDDNATLALGGFERAIQKLSAESLIAAFGGNDDEFCSGARRVLDQDLMTKVERMETSEVVEQVIEVQDDSIASSICSRSLLPLELDVTYCSCCNAPFNEDIEANGPFWQGPCNYCFMPRPAHFKERDNAEVVTLIPLEL